MSKKRGRLRENHGRPGERLRSSDHHHSSSSTQQVDTSNRLVRVREAVRKRKGIKPEPVIETRPTTDYRVAIMAARLRARPRPFPAGGKPPATRPQPYVSRPPLTYNGPLQR